MKLKILIITDSLGLPRDKPEKVEYDETWVSQLKEKFQVHQFSLGGGTIDTMVTQIEYLKMYKPDFVIIQAGIVDSAPRALSKCELQFVKKKRWLSKFFKRKKVLKFLRKNRKLSYTNEADFTKNIKKMKKEFGETLYWVEILTPNVEYENMMPGIKDKVLSYNQIIVNELKNNLFETRNFNKDCVMSDMIHLNKLGHLQLLKLVETELLNRTKI